MVKILPAGRAGELSLPAKAKVLLASDQPAFFEALPDCSVAAFPWDGGRERVAVCLGREALYVVCGGDSCMESVRRRMPGDVPPERALYGLLSAMLRDDMDALDELETQITDVEDDALQSIHSDCLRRIVHYRRTLLYLKRYYARLDALFDSLCANDNGLLTDDGVRRFSVLMERNRRLLDAAVHLRDYVTQMREAYQAQLDLEQNHLMKVFTVVTALSTPLTLIAGWYGMNFQHMPELAGRWSYPIVCAVGAAIVGALAALFHKKGWI